MRGRQELGCCFTIWAPLLSSLSLLFLDRSHRDSDFLSGLGCLVTSSLGLEYQGGGWLQKMHSDPERKESTCSFVRSFIRSPSRESAPVRAWYCARPGGFRAHWGLGFSLPGYGEEPSFWGLSFPLDSHPFSSSSFLDQPWALVNLI